MNQKEKERKEKEKARQRAISEAVQDEMDMVNNVIANGGIAIIKTFCGEYQLDCVRTDFWYITHPEGNKPNPFNQRSWAGCNNGTWATIMEQLGLERHPLFKKTSEISERVNNGN